MKKDKILILNKCNNSFPQKHVSHNITESLEGTLKTGIKPHLNCTTVISDCAGVYGPSAKG